MKNSISEFKVSNNKGISILPSGTNFHCSVLFISLYSIIISPIFRALETWLSYNSICMQPETFIRDRFRCRVSLTYSSLSLHSRLKWSFLFRIPFLKSAVSYFCGNLRDFTSFSGFYTSPGWQTGNLKTLLDDRR